MNKKISIGATIALMIISIALTISVTMVVAMRIFNSSVNDVTQRRTMYQYVTEIDKAVRPHYLGTIDEEKLRTALARGYVDGIGDPYAAYLSADEYKAVQQARSGKLTGYGIELSRTEDGMPQITSVSKQSPGRLRGCAERGYRRFSRWHGGDGRQLRYGGGKAGSYHIRRQGTHRSAPR